MTLIAVIAVVGIVITTVLLTRDGQSNTLGTAPSPSASAVASANDNGPVQIITDEPTCDAWSPIINNVASPQNDAWLKRDRSTPATDWDPQTRLAYQTVGQISRTAADATVALAQQTPHRLVRELYTQFITYSRAFADAVPNYTAPDDELLNTANAAASTISAICDTITTRSAQARAASGVTFPAPNPPPQIGDLTKPARLMTSLDPICQDWVDEAHQYFSDIEPMTTVDTGIIAAQWTPEQKAIVDAAVPIMTASADRMAELGANSSNPVIKDLANLAAVYRHTYVTAVPTYVADDTYLYNVGQSASNTIKSACVAAGAKR